MFVPFPVMRVLLEKNISPRQAFLDMQASLESNHALMQFSTLLDFLRIAGTADNTGDPNNLHLTPGLYSFQTKKLVGFMKEEVLYRDLPFRNPCTTTTGNHDGQLTQTLTLLTDAQLKANATNERAKTKSPTYAFGETNVCKFLLLCHVELPGDLPQLYDAWANVPKNKDLQLVFADAISAAADHFLISNPVAITTSTLTCLHAFRFCVWDHKFHSGGLLPMAFVSPGVSSSPKALDAQNLYALQSGSLEPLLLSLANIKELPAAKGYICTGCLRQCSNWMPTYLSSHPSFVLTTRWW